MLLRSTFGLRDGSLFPTVQWQPEFATESNHREPALVYRIWIEVWPDPILWEVS